VTSFPHLAVRNHADDTLSTRGIQNHIMIMPSKPKIMYLNSIVYQYLKEYSV